MYLNESLKLILLILAGINFCFGGGMQRYAVKGVLLCGKTPSQNTKVKLVDVDNPGFDDVMDVSYTDENGEFFLAGQTEEITPIDPVLKIYHGCPDGMPCSRRSKAALPKHHIFKPDEDPKVYDVGILNLEVNFRNDRRTCF